MEPLKVFEAQVKEVEEPIDKAIANLDAQLAEIKALKQEQKRKEIEKQFKEGGFPDWLTLDQLWNDKWLNSTVTINQIITDIDEQVKHINGNLLTINALPEFAFEAEEIYKKTLDFGEAVRRAKEMSEIAKRKAAAEAAKNTPTTPQNGEKEPGTDTALKIERIGTPVQGDKTPVNGGEADKPKVYTFRFDVTVTAAQAAALGVYCKEQGIKLIRVQ